MVKIVNINDIGVKESQNGDNFDILVTLIHLLHQSRSRQKVITELMQQS